MKPESAAEAQPVTIIAEAGVNHNGQLDVAEELVCAAKSAGANYVKFQHFSPADIVTANLEAAPYQRSAKFARQRKMLESLCLNEEQFERLVNLCKEVEIGFLTTPHDLPSGNHVFQLGLDFVKIGSGDLTNKPLLELAAKQPAPVILSSGMSTMIDIARAIEVLGQNGKPKSSVTVLHCVTSYPTPIAQANVMAMKSISEELGVAVGYSDHTEGHNACLAAVALGARVIEKHITLDRNLEGPDHRTSMEPQEFGKLVGSIREIEMALGTGVKIPQECERENITLVRKVLVALQPIEKGEPLTRQNVGAKRGGEGISPMRIDEVVGKPAPQKFAVDDLIWMS